MSKSLLELNYGRSVDGPITRLKSSLSKKALLIRLAGVLSLIVLVILSFAIHFKMWTEPLLGVQLGFEIGQGTIEVSTSLGRQNVPGIGFFEPAPTRWWIDFGRVGSAWQIAVPTWLLAVIVLFYIVLRLRNRQEPVEDMSSL